MLAETCGDAANSPSALAAVRLLGNADLAATFAGRDLESVRPGGSAACWCGDAECAALASCGSVEVRGPERGQKWQCARGQGCVLEGVEGRGLSDMGSSELRIMRACGASVALGKASGGQGGARFAFETLDLDVGMYELCWCGGELEGSAGLGFIGLVVLDLSRVRVGLSSDELTLEVPAEHD